MAKDEKKAPKQQPKTRRKTTDKWKKKSWFEIVAPEEFERKIIGETVAEKPETLIGRVIKVTGRDLANQPKKQQFVLKFRVKEVKGQKAITEVIGHSIKDSFLKRLVRRRASKIMTVNNYETNDKEKFKVKVVVVSDRKASRNQRRSIRNKADELMKKLISEINSKKVVDELVFGSLPAKMQPELKKIIPIKRIEITGSKFLVAK